MDIALYGYFDLNSIELMTLSSQPEPRNIIWILFRYFTRLDIMTLTPQLALGWEALHIVGTVGGGVLTWMLECTKNPL